MEDWAMELMEEMDTDVVELEPRPTIKLSVYDVAVEVTPAAMHGVLSAKGLYPHFVDETVDDVRKAVYAPATKGAGR